MYYVKNAKKNHQNTNAQVALYALAASIVSKLTSNALPVLENEARPTLSLYLNSLTISSCPIIICLEEIKRVADSARRTRTKLHPHPPYSRLPPHRQDLKRAAARRRTKLLFLPSGMSKRGKNQTQYDPRKKSISWTIEWRFHSTDVKHLKPGPWNHPLRQFVISLLDSLKFLSGKYPKSNQICHHNASVKALENIFDDSLAVRSSSEWCAFQLQEREGTFENMEFDFDQGLMDAYSDLIAQINPDDFLDLEGVFSKEEEDRNDHFGSMGTFSVGEELEEGRLQNN
ncbi:hypothetical protein H0E87_001816 [Populus deltoides]|uniref:BCD1 alpha/beta domain-containing protein n=1 Tax=Populus deltoides TaxID=3696 RepID=A0A8T2ZT74_POPDE|nr:hypothetical protein H0E87_001816 [Populus deltoides]